MVFRKHRRRQTESNATQASASGSSSVLPNAVKARLNHSFRDIEKEMEALYLENCQLREKIAILEKGQATSLDATQEFDKERSVEEPDAFEAVLKTFSKKNALKTRHKLKAQTSKIVSSFKAPGQVASLVKEYRVSPEI